MYQAFTQFPNIDRWVILSIIRFLLFFFYNTGPVVDKSYTDCTVGLMLQDFPLHVSQPPSSLS